MNYLVILFVYFYSAIFKINPSLKEHLEHFYTDSPMQQNLADILHPQQIKDLISKLREIDLRDYGSKLWFSQDENLQKLNMQAHVGALLKTDSFILEEFVTQDKLKLLIYDLIATDVWKTQVLPTLQPHFNNLNTFRSYIAVYHEAVVCNILEILLYTRTGVDGTGDYLVDLISYCYNKMAKLVAKHMNAQRKAAPKKQEEDKLTAEEKQKKQLKEIIERTPAQEFERQCEQIEFSVTMMCISIIRYVTDYVKHFEIGIIHHLVVECNIFEVLVPLIESKPWLRTNSKGEREIFDNNKWRVLEKSEYSVLPKIEGQIWLSLYNLFMDPECRKKYELTENRKSVLLRLRKFMNDILLDNIEALRFMLRSLEELSLMNVPSQSLSNPFIVQIVPQVKSRITYNRNYKELGTSHLSWISANSDAALKEEMKRLADLYSNSTIEGLVEGFKCNKCTKEAFKRCSKCKSVWYCTRECQVADWKEHKPKCNQIIQKKQDEERLEEAKAEAQKKLITEMD